MQSVIYTARVGKLFFLRLTEKDLFSAIERFPGGTAGKPVKYRTEKVPPPMCAVRPLRSMGRMCRVHAEVFNKTGSYLTIVFQRVYLKADYADRTDDEILEHFTKLIPEQFQRDHLISIAADLWEGVEGSKLGYAEDEVA